MQLGSPHPGHQAATYYRFGVRGDSQTSGLGEEPPFLGNQASAASIGTGLDFSIVRRTQTGGRDRIPSIALPPAETQERSACGDQGNGAAVGRLQRWRWQSQETDDRLAGGCCPHCLLFGEVRNPRAGSYGRSGRARRRSRFWAANCPMAGSHGWHPRSTTLLPKREPS